MGNFTFFTNINPLYVEIVAGLSILLSLLAMIFASVAMGRARRLRRRYRQLMTGENGADLEQMVLKHSQQANAALSQLRDIQEQIADHERRLRNKTNTPKVLRNASRKPVATATA